MERFVYIFTLFISVFTQAQKEIKIEADTNQAFIGDVINVKLQVYGNQNILWPDIEESIAPLELQNLSSIDSSFTRSKNLYTQNITVQQFDTGNFVLPQLPFISLDGDTSYSDSFAFSFLAVPLDTTNAVFDIKKPKKVPFNFSEAKPYIYGFIGLIILIILLYYLIRIFNKNNETVEEVVELIPCEIEAINALKNLEYQALCKKGLVKEHYVQLTDILRRYFDREYQIDTLESTTDEIVLLLKGVKLNKALLKDISKLLTEADLVKFAKNVPDNKANNAFMRKSYTIVENCHKIKEEEKDV